MAKDPEKLQDSTGEGVAHISGKVLKIFASVFEEVSTHRCGISDPFARRSIKHLPITRRMGTAHICRIHDAKGHRQQQSVMQVKVMQVSASFQPRVAPPLISLDNNLKETEGDKQSFSWPTQHQGTELPLPLYHNVDVPIRRHCHAPSMLKERC